MFFIFKILDNFSIFAAIVSWQSSFLEFQSACQVEALEFLWSVRVVVRDLISLEKVGERHCCMERILMER